MNDINNFMLDVLDFKVYKKKKNILIELKHKGIEINERSLRQVIAKNNKLFAECQSDFYIAHSSQGYKKTYDWGEMKKSIANNRKRAITMLIDCDRTEKQFQRRNNLQLDLNYEDYQQEEKRFEEKNNTEEMKRTEYEEDRYADYEVQNYMEEK